VPSGSSSCGRLQVIGWLLSVLQRMQYSIQTLLWAHRGCRDCQKVPREYFQHGCDSGRLSVVTTNVGAAPAPVCLNTADQPQINRKSPQITDHCNYCLTPKTVASEAICKWGCRAQRRRETPAESFLMCPLTFLLCPPPRGTTIVYYRLIEVVKSGVGQ